MKGQWDKINVGSRFMKGGVNRQLTLENRDRTSDALTCLPDAKVTGTLFDTFPIEVFR